MNMELNQAQIPITLLFFIRLTDNRQTERHFHRVCIAMEHHPIYSVLKAIHFDSGLFQMERFDVKHTKAHK